MLSIQLCILELILIKFIVKIDSAIILYIILAPVAVRVSHGCVVYGTSGHHMASRIRPSIFADLLDAGLNHCKACPIILQLRKIGR